MRIGCPRCRVQPLTADWRPRSNSGKHSLVWERAGDSAVSARLPDYRILVVFPERLAGTDRLRHQYHDTRGQLQSLQIP